MTALQFPAEPNVGDIFQTWEWDGYKWVATGSEPELPPVQLTFAYPSMPSDAMGLGPIIMIPIAFPITVPTNPTIKSYAYTNPAAVLGWTFYRRVMPSAITTMGTMNLATNGTWSQANWSSDIAFNAGDVIYAICNGDTAAQGVGISILAERT